jgi:N-acetylmuramoyl-L-alanine amidase
MGGFDILLTCIALTVYHEARGEPYESQFAVASVVINRAVKDYSGDTCQAAFAESQFTWTQWGYDRKHRKLTSAGIPRDRQSWNKALEVGKDAIYRRTLPDLFYYHTKTSKPTWARGKTVVVSYGQHSFYGA